MSQNLVVSAAIRRCYTISLQNNLELHAACGGDGQSLGRAGGRAGGVRSRDYQIFSDG